MIILPIVSEGEMAFSRIDVLKINREAKTIRLQPSGATQTWYQVACEISFEFAHLLLYAHMTDLDGHYDYKDWELDGEKLRQKVSSLALTKQGVENKS